jgi:hypothetical protein
MKAKWMCAAATAALLIASANVHAQTAEERKQEPSATQQQSPAAETAREKQQTPSTGAAQAPAGATAGSSKGDKSQSESAQDRTGSDAKQSDAPREPAARSSQSKDDAAAGKAATRKDGGKEDGPTGQVGSSGAKSNDTTQARDKDDDGNRRTSGQSQEQKSTGDSDRRGRADAKSGDAGDRIQVTERERTTIQKSIDVQKARVNIDIDVNIGSPVPRSVTLYPLPAAIIDINPRWRNYRYVVVRDEIIIINPQTYVVVEVIPVSGSTQARASRGTRGSVQLSAQQRQRILTYARAECRTVLTEPGFQVGVGIRIPERIELCPFEDVIVQEVGVVRPYRFFVVQDQVVLVDPGTHELPDFRHAVVTAYDSLKFIAIEH